MTSLGIIKMRLLLLLLMYHLYLIAAVTSAEVTIISVVNYFSADTVTAIDSWKLISKYITIISHSDDVCESVGKYFQSITIVCVKDKSNKSYSFANIIHDSAKHSTTKFCVLIQNSILSVPLWDRFSHRLYDFKGNVFIIDKNDSAIDVHTNGSENVSTVPYYINYVLFSRTHPCIDQLSNVDLFDRHGLLDFSFQKCISESNSISRVEDLPNFGRYLVDQPHFVKVSNHDAFDNTSSALTHLKSHSKWMKNMLSSVHPTGYLFVVTVNNEQLALFSLWLNWAKVAGFSKFLVFAMDEESEELAQSLHLHTFSPAKIRHYSYSDKIAFRHGFFLLLLKYGISFISLGVNTLVLNNPQLPSPSKDKEIMIHSWKDSRIGGTRISSDLFGISANGLKSDSFLRRVSRCVNGTITKGGRKGMGQRDEYSTPAIVNLKYQSCIEKSYSELHRDGRKETIEQSFSYFSKEAVVNSHQFFVEKLPQSNGIIPALLHINSPSNESAKIALLKEWNMILENGNNDNPQVRSAPYVNHSTIRALIPASHSIVTIRIITMDRPEPLRRLLISLQDAIYDSEAVHIEFYVDKPAQGKDTTNYNAVVSIVNAFVWTHGTVKRHFEAQNAGIFKMWVRPFPAEDHQGPVKHFLMVLEDDMQLSPYYYMWAKRVLLNYSPHEEGNLYGFTIQRQHSVIGIKKGGKYELTYVDKRVPVSSPFYRYQLLSTWGQFFYPRHWNAFVEWALKARQQVGFDPCVPYLFCNKWYLDRPHHIWSIWFNYYVYQTGLTNLYLNYNYLDKQKDYGLLINYRENGLHFSKKKLQSEFANVILINETMKIPLPSLTSFPLYNFFFAAVDNEELLRHQWRFTSNFGNNSCITNI